MVSILTDPAGNLLQEIGILLKGLLGIALVILMLYYILQCSQTYYRIVL